MGFMGIQSARDNLKPSGSKPSEKSSESEKPVCPRCGKPISFIEEQRKGDRVYYIAHHYLGYEGGRKKEERCYLGPKKYVLVEGLHGLELAGMIDPSRERRYLEKLLMKANLPLADLLELIGLLAKRALELAKTAKYDKQLLALAGIVKERVKGIYDEIYVKRWTQAR